MKRSLSIFWNKGTHKLPLEIYAMNMKMGSILAGALLPWLMVHADTIADIRRDASTLLNRVRASKAWDEMSSDEYFNGLRHLAARGQGLNWNPQVTASSDVITAFLGMAIDYPKIEEQVAELGDWYGGVQAEVPKARREQQLAPAAGKGRMPGLADNWNVYNKMHIQRVEPLHDEHATMAYREAWEVWLIAPPFRKNSMIRLTVIEALARIGSSSSIPLLIEAMQRNASHQIDDKGKRNEALGFIGVLRVIGGEEGLASILECHRMAIPGGYAGEETEIFSSEVAKILASQPSSFDRNPNSRELAENKLEAFNRLIVAKVAQAEKLPKEDQALLKETMQHMNPPKE